MKLPSPFLARSRTRFDQSPPTLHDIYVSGKPVHVKDYSRDPAPRYQLFEAGTTVSNSKMLLRIALICAMLLSTASLGLAGEKEKTHPVRPTELLDIIGRADKVILYDSTPAMYVSGGSVPPAILYSSTNPRDISELKESIAVERPKSWFRCACIPPIEIVLSLRGRKLGVISVYEELTIGFSRWSGDARAAKQEKLLRWFDARGITGPRLRIQTIQARESAERGASERWVNAMPVSLRPLWSKLMDDRQWWSDPGSAPAASASALKPELAREFPDPKKRILWLFSWFGSGAGPWSGFPAYEEVPARLLLDYQLPELLAALRDTTLTESETEGAARFFSGYCHGYDFCPPEENKEIPLLPKELKKTLLQHVLNSPDVDKVEWARKAFERH
ncbi:MAG: hypothetical protein JWO20_95 [Candidatus Angelobacter sp.]|nr:hypothetical protein [Candidatus Angelobacter sp.]